MGVSQHVGIGGHVGGNPKKLVKNGNTGARALL